MVDFPFQSGFYAWMKFNQLRLVFGLWLAAFSGGQIVTCLAADVRVLPQTVPELAIIGVEGRFEPGDEKKFSQIALQFDRAVVAFNSPGGDLQAGIGIGKAIRLKEFTTLVGENVQCASACGLAWLAGAQRLAHSKAMIGFHAAYTIDGTTTKESGAANALVGAYLNQLGLPVSTIIHLTEKPPEDMAWLPLGTAKAWGIDFEIIGTDNVSTQPQTPPGPGQPSVLPSMPKIISKTLDGFDVFGFDQPLMPLKGVALEGCIEACNRDASCKAFTYNKPNSACFLKSYGARVVGNQNAVAGYKSEIESNLTMSPMTVLEKTDFPGGDFKKVTKVDFESCLSQCEENSSCVAFTYVRRHKICWLKSSVSEPARNKSAISGLRIR